MDGSVLLLALRLLPTIEAAGTAGLIVVVDGDHRAEALARLLSRLLPGRSCPAFPAWDCLPYDRAAPSPDIMGHRMRVLRALAKRPEGSVVVTTPEALLQRVPAPGALPRPLVLKPGAAFDPEGFAAGCARLGYTHADRVEDPGQVAIRGETVDIFAPRPMPTRISLAGGVVTALHGFEPASQRSGAPLEGICIDPVTEAVLPEGADTPRFPGMEHWLPLFVPTLVPLLDYLPDAPVLFGRRAGARFATLFAQVAEAHRDRLAADAAGGEPGEHRAVEPDRLFLTEAEWAARGAPRVQPMPSLEDAEPAPRFCLDDKPAQLFKRFVEAQAAEGRRIVLAGARSRDLHLLERAAERATGVAPMALAEWAELPALFPGSVGVLRLAADHGVVDPAGGVAVVTAADLLGHHARALSAHAVHVPWHLGDGEFALGDRVIHLDHGVGELVGLETVEEGGGFEAVRLRYADATDLIVPVEEMDRIWRYAGAADDVPVDKLDGAAWPKRRAKVAKEIEGTAEALVTLAGQRRQAPAPALVPPRRDYERFVDGFAFAPTADQIHAVDDCLKDMAAPHPMDRLVVGDVGFGKTEVALRAAAAAVLAGAQVAVVAPTTVLVRQHVQTFTRRFAALGVDVAHLSRLVAPADAARVKQALADGTAPLVVGTQALAAADVRFARLGLLIIDEEQRFGAADKAAIRALGAGVHVLTMSATPIPRTLQAALVGLQDLSTITTPPARRRPIRTLLAPHDPATMRAALLKEKARGGQSYVVVPRIEDLDTLAAELRALMPDCTLMIGHGRMETEAIDAAMSAFAAGEGDVLLATSIIESGLDVPRANTMIVCGADRFGLAQLHQLRGRVGRGQRQGVCYLMTAHDLSPATERRLATLTRLDRLGSGMAISAQDLDARGGGEMMGDTQSGHLSLIGLGLYQHLLQAAIRRAGRGGEEEWSPELHLGDAGRFPADYIPEPELRINLYARLARAFDTGEVEGLAAEVADRFGPMPAAVAALFARAKLKSLCRSHRVARVDAGPKAIAFTPRPGLGPEALLEAAPASARGAYRLKDRRLLVDLSEPLGAAERVQRSADLLDAMA